MPCPSKYRSQNVLGRSEHFVQNQKFNCMGTLKSVCSSWFGLISRDKYEHTHLRVPIQCHSKTFCAGTKIELTKYKSSFGLTKKIWTSTNYFGTCKRTRHKCNLIFGLAKTIWNGPKCFGICRRTRNLPNLMFDEFLTILMYVEVLFPTTPIDTTFIRWNFSRIFRNKQNFQ